MVTDELEIDEARGQPTSSALVSADELEIGPPARLAKPSRRPKPQPKKPPRQPLKAAPIESPTFDEGLEIREVSGGPRYEMVPLYEQIMGGVGSPTFRRVTPPLEFEATGVRRKTGESTEAFLRRAEEFGRNKQALEQRARQLRFEARQRSRKPAGFIEKALTGYTQGVGGALSSAATGLGEAIPDVRNYLDRIGMEPTAPPPSALALSPEDQQSWTTKIAGAIGGTVPQVLSSMLPIGGAGAAFGILQGAGSTYQDAIANGATDKEAKAASTIGGLLGLLDSAFGLGKAGLFKGGHKPSLWRYVKEIGEEAVTEGLQRFGENLNAKLLSGYDPKRALLEGVAEDALLGAIVGGFFNLPQLPGALKRLGKKAPVEPLPQAIQSPELSSDLSPAEVEPSIPAGTKEPILADDLEPDEIRPSMQAAVEPTTPNSKGPFNRDSLLTGEEVEQILTAAGYDREARSNTYYELSGLLGNRDSTYHQDPYAPFMVPAGMLEGFALGEISPDEFRAALNQAGYGDIENAPMEDVLPPQQEDEELTTIRALRSGQMTVEEAQRQGLTEKYPGIEKYAGRDVRASAAPSSSSAAAPVSADTGERQADPRLKFDPFTFRKTLESEEQGARFYPARGESQAGTVYVTPQTMIDLGLARNRADLRNVGAVNIDLDQANRIYQRALVLAPEQAEEISRAIGEADRKDLGSVNIAMYGPGMGIAFARQSLRHETLHGGQYEAAKEINSTPGLTKPDIRDLHSPALRDHPMIQQMIPTYDGQTILKNYNGDLDSLVFEAAAYSAAGQTEALFQIGEDQALEFLYGYSGDLVKKNGIQALDKIEATARLREPVKKVFERVRNEQRQRDFGNQPGEGELITPLTTAASSTRRSGLPGGGVEDPTGSGQSEPAGTGGQGGVQAPNAGGQTEDSGTTGQPVWAIHEPILNEQYERAINQAMMVALQDGSIPYDLTKRPFEQVQDALVKGQLDIGVVDRALEANGLKLEDIKEEYAAAISRSGRALQRLSQQTRKWQRLIRTNPQLAERLLPKEKFIRLALKDLRRSDLGRSMWIRSGDMMRKMALTQFSIAAYNAISTVGTLPLNILDGLTTGLAMGVLQPSKYGNLSPAQLASEGLKGNLRTMQGAMEVATGIPKAALDLILRRQSPRNFQEYNEVLSQLQTFHPDLHGKLMGQASSLEGMGAKGVAVETIDRLLAFVNDTKRRDRLAKEFAPIKARYQFNRTVAGKAIKGTEGFYDWFLQPMAWQEYAFRKPFFVGALRAEVAKEGHDLPMLIQKGQFDLVSKAAIERAIDSAMEFTYAYTPHAQGKGQTEKVAHYLIRAVNEAGPLGFLVEGFPRAIYNGMRFWYQWGPLGMLTPSWRVGQDLVQGGREAVREDDVRRLSRAAIGTIALGLAFGLREAAGGEEWWQLKTGKKRKDGKPIYLDARRYMPVAGYLFMADLAQRFSEGRAIDKKLSQEWQQVYLGMRRTGQQGSPLFDGLDEMFKYWGGEEMKEGFIRRGETVVGRQFALPLTPLLNVRDLWAQFSEAENVRKDVSESPLLGPSLDRIPWLRQSLPNATAPLESTPLPISEAPVLSQFGGITLRSGGNFATSELARLGINPRRFIKRDPDPLIDRAQNLYLSQLLEKQAPLIESNPYYRSIDDRRKAAYWELIFAGGGQARGLADLAREAAQWANKDEVMKRQLEEQLRQRGIGPLGQRALGLDEKLQEMGRPGASSKP